jgi:hypothetical protein
MGFRVLTVTRSSKLHAGISDAQAFEHGEHVVTFCGRSGRALPRLLHDVDCTSCLKYLDQTQWAEDLPENRKAN